MSANFSKSIFKMLYFWRILPHIHCYYVEAALSVVHIVDLDVAFGCYSEFFHFSGRDRVKRITVLVICSGFYLDKNKHVIFHADDVDLTEFPKMEVTLFYLIAVVGEIFVGDTLAQSTSGSVVDIIPP